MSVNKVILVGNVGKDPDVRYFDNGSAVANFTLATTERGYTASNGTVVPERTEWHNIVVWRGLAQVVEKYVKKGTQVYIEGKLRTRSYDDASGNKRYVTEIYADELQLMGRKSDNPAASEGGYTQPAQSSASSMGQSAGNAPSSFMSDNDDASDLPF